MVARVEMIGKTFGRLEVLSSAGSTVRGLALWKCRCECGEALTVKGSLLRSGDTKSCGCWKSRIDHHLVSHGHNRGKGQRSKTYRAWAHMKARCDNPNVERYPHYGGRGISYATKWASFPAFLADMGEAPDGCSLDRIDVNGNYEPGNCRWATAKQQARNTRASKMITAFGATRTVAEWAELKGLGPATIHNRLYSGDDPETALRPVR